MPANVPSDMTPRMRSWILVLFVEEELPVTVADAAARWRSIDSVGLAIV